MSRIEVQAPAKINLTLDIVGKREDGYHLLESVFQAVGVYDTLLIEQTEGSEIVLTSPNRFLPCNPKNIAYQAAERFFAATNTRCGLHIHIEKHIPSQAGLGGGSADGAAVLFALNRLLHTNLSPEALCAIGAQVGADVPFFLLGGTVLVEGIGERLTPLRPLPKLPLVIAKGKAGVSTPEAYRLLDGLSRPQKRRTKAVLAAVNQRHIGNLARACGNHFEAAIHLPEIDAIRTTLHSGGAGCAVMSGSGAAVYGLCASAAIAKACRNRLYTVVPYAVSCTTVPTGITLLSEEL